MAFIQNHIPLYLKLYWKLRDEIFFQERLPGERMPTVEELHEQYGVSQSTVHKALDLLEKDELILKRRARGIFVKEDIRVPLWDPVFTPETFQVEVRNFHDQQVSEGWINAPQNLRNIFAGQEGVFKQNRIYRFQALRIHNEEPRRKVFLSAYFPAWLMASVPNTGLSDYAPNGFIEIGEHRAERILRISRPWICDTEVAQKFDILEGTAIFRRMLLYHDKNDRLMVCCDYSATAHATYQESRIDWNKS